MNTTEWTELADRVWSRRYGFADETVGVVAGSGGLLVVDTRATPRDARELRRDIAALSDLPVVAAANTHGHWDHAFGNSVFSDVPIWGHAACPDFLSKTARPMRQRLLNECRDDEDRRALEEVVVAPPSRLLRRSARVDLGDRTVELRHFGRGHTDNDIAALVPDAGVAFVGDLVKSDGPPGYRDAYPLDWPDTLSRLMLAITGGVVPGHGPPVGALDVDAFRVLLAEVRRRIVLVRRGEIAPNEAMDRPPIHPRALAQAFQRCGITVGSVP